MSSALIAALLDTLRLGGDADSLANRWVGMPTAGLLELVAHEGASVWLYRRLRSSGALNVLSAGVREQLRVQAFQEAGKAMRVEEEAVAVIGALTGAGFSVIATKGVARLALAVRHPYLDARATNDVDLLVREDQAREAFRFLLTEGYEQSPAGDAPPDHFHLPGLWSERRVVVELHQSTSATIPPHVAWERATEGAEEVTLAGLPVMIPPTAELAWNAIAHGVSESARGFRLQNFLEVAALVAGGGQLNWTAIHERAAAEEACDSDTGVRVRASVVFRWLDAALALTAAGTAARPEWLSSFDLQGLLEWRVKSIETRRRFGRRFADGMMEEGALALIGLPMQKAPAGRAWPIQVRRRAASTASRLLFRAWSAGRSA